MNQFKQFKSFKPVKELAPFSLIILKPHGAINISLADLTDNKTFQRLLIVQLRRNRRIFFSLRASLKLGFAQGAPAHDSRIDPSLWSGHFSFDRSVFAS